MSATPLTNRLKRAPEYALRTLLRRVLGDPLVPPDLLASLPDEEEAILRDVVSAFKIERDTVGTSYEQRQLLVEILTNALSFKVSSAKAGRDERRRLAVEGLLPLDAYRIKWEDRARKDFGGGLTDDEILSILSAPVMMEHATTTWSDAHGALGARIAVGLDPHGDRDAIIVVATYQGAEILNIENVWRASRQLVDRAGSATEVFRLLLVECGVPFFIQGYKRRLLAFGEHVILGQHPNKSEPVLSVPNRQKGDLMSGVIYHHLTRLNVVEVLLGYTVDLHRYRGLLSSMPVADDRLQER